MSRLRTFTPGPIEIALLLFTLTLRLINLGHFPVFIDEGTHIFWTRLFAAQTPTYPFLADGRLLAIALFSLFDLSGPQPLWLARAVVAVLSAVNGAACIALGRRLNSPATGWLAGGLYAVLPYALFYDRQALTDPLATAFGSLVLIGTLRLIHTRRWQSGLMVSVAVAAAVLVKFSAGVYLALFVIAVIVWPRRLGLIRQFGVALGLAALLATVFLWALGPLRGTPGGLLANAELSLLQCPPALCQGDLAEQWRRLPLALNSLPEVAPPYFGWPVLGAAVFGFAVGWDSRRRRLAALLGLLFVAMVLSVVATMRTVVVPRYLGFVVVPLLVLAANGLAFFLNRRGSLAFAILLVVVVLPFRNSLTLLSTPLQVELPTVDRTQYFTGVYSGIGFQEIGQAISERETDPTQPPLILNKTPWQILPTGAYLDARYLRNQPANEVQWPVVQAAFDSGRRVYMIEEFESEVAAETTTLLTLPREGEAKPLRLRVFTGPTPDLFDAVFPRPDAYLDAYTQLVAESSPDVVLVPYPLSQATVLKELGAVTVMDLNERWQVTPLSRPLRDEACLRTVFLDEARLDPAHNFEHGLAADFYHVGTRWYGPLRVVDWVGAVDLDRVWQADWAFGEAGVLRAVEVAEAAARPGEPLRVRVTWSALKPTPVAYKVFVHLIANEQIIAQHDSEPVADLRPTTGWQPGETLTHQIALEIPADLPPGELRLRIGLYDPDTGGRLLTGDGAEFYVTEPITLGGKVAPR